MIAPYFGLVLPDSNPGARGIAVTTDPPWLRALAVQMGRHVVFLPYYNADASLYERLLEAARESRELRFTGELIAEWPGRPVFAHDFP